MSVRYDNEWMVAANAYADAKTAFDEAKKKFEVAKDNLLSLTEEDASGFGVSVKFIERRGSIDYAKVVKDKLPDIDVEPYRRATASVSKIDFVTEE